MPQNLTWELRLFFPTLPFLVAPIGDPPKHPRRRELIIESAAVALRRWLVKVPVFLVAFIVSFGGQQKEASRVMHNIKGRSTFDMSSSLSTSDCGTITNY